MSARRLAFVAVLLVVVFAFKKEDHKPASAPAKPVALSQAQQLGKMIFFDAELSNPPGKACAGCHQPTDGFAAPDHANVSEGVTGRLFGTRNAPSVCYAAYVPPMYYDSVEETYVGGLFWDGRAKTLVDQADGPLMTRHEMNNSNHTMVVNKVRTAGYAKLYETVYGKGSFTNVEEAYKNICRAVSDYERSAEVNPFTSKFDYYLVGKAQLTAAEKRGLDLFNDSTKGNCFSCHPSTADDASGKVLFTDFSYDNIGTPYNKGITNVNAKYTTDYGLGTIVKDHLHNGKFRVPTLRNVAITAPYLHNGIFNTLDEVMDFYNERDLGKFGEPEVAENVNRKELGNLKLSQQEKNDIVAFMKTLTDGYQPAVETQEVRR